MTAEAFRRSWEGYVLAWVWTRMAILALQAQCDMGSMTVR